MDKLQKNMTMAGGPSVNHVYPDSMGKKKKLPPWHDDAPYFPPKGKRSEEQQMWINFDPEIENYTNKKMRWLKYEKQTEEGPDGKPQLRVLPEDSESVARFKRGLNEINRKHPNTGPPPLPNWNAPGGVTHGYLMNAFDEPTAPNTPKTKHKK